MSKTTFELDESTNIITVKNHIATTNIQLIINKLDIDWKVTYLSGYSFNIRLLRFGEVSKYIGLRLFGELKNNVTHKKNYKHIRSYYLNRYVRYISKHLSGLMKHIVQKCVPDDILYLHKKLYARFGPKRYSTASLSINDINSNKFRYFLNDIKNGYDFALIIFLNSISVIEEVKNDSYKDGIAIGYNVTNKLDFRNNINEWMKLFSTRTGLINYNLIKTLKNGKKLPIDDIIDLQSFYMDYTKKCPILPDTLSSKFLSSLINRLKYYHHDIINDDKLLNSLNKKNLFLVRDIICKQLRRKLNLRKRSDIRFIVTYIFDYLITNKKFSGNILTLARKSVQWHIEENIRTKEKVLKEVELNRNKIVKFPVELPKNLNITFLNNVQSIIEEGANMGHCVAYYANKALNGGCYLFHIKWKNESATAEISNNYEIQQIHGPHNSDNKACKYGRKVLSKYCKEIKNKIELDKTVKNNYYNIINNDMSDIPF